MTKGQLIIAGIAVGGLLIAAFVGTLWGIMRDGARRQAEYDRAWAQKKAELERAEQVPE